MKLLKLILTAILFTVTFVIILAAEYATLYALSFPVRNETERVHLFECEGSAVCYADSIGFWTTDFEASTRMPEPKFVIRSWFSWQWWQNGMKWADRTYSYVTEFVAPVIAPIYVANDMQLHYGIDPTPENIAMIISQKTGKNYQVTLDRVEYAFSVRDSGYVFMTRNEWLKEYNDVYNVEIMIAKYNQVDTNGNPVFEKYIVKFFDEDGNFKAVGMLLFYQIFLAVILSLYFTYQNPVIINRNASNENEIEGRFLPRVPKIGRIGIHRREKKDRRSRR
jgi:hypothetical protein